jgi:hypothetical protein
MLKREYLDIKNNEKIYRAKYYITFTVGSVGILLIFVYVIMFKNFWLLIIVFFLLSYLYNYHYKSKYKIYIYTKKYDCINGIEINNYFNLILNRLNSFNYKVLKVNNDFYKANKKSRKYAIYYVDELSDKNIKTKFSLSRKQKYVQLMKHSFENYNLVNIIISNHIGNDAIDLFHYDGFNLSPHNEIFIGVDLGQGKVYMNYGANNIKNSFSKELFNIVTGIND